MVRWSQIFVGLQELHNFVYGGQLLSTIAGPLDTSSSSSGRQNESQRTHRQSVIGVFAIQRLP
mgnify:CR=1 FL=1